MDSLFFPLVVSLFIVAPLIIILMCLIIRKNTRSKWYFFLPNIFLNGFLGFFLPLILYKLIKIPSNSKSFMNSLPFVVVYIILFVINIFLAKYLKGKLKDLSKSITTYCISTFVVYICSCITLILTISVLFIYAFANM